MKKILFLSILSISYLSLNAQIIGNKIDLSLTYIVGKFGGDDMFNADGFISPSLYSNFDHQSGLSIKGILLKKQRLSFGASFNFASASEWNSDLYTDYLNSGVSLYSLSPLMQIHSKLDESGFFNRFRIFLEMAPAIGISKITLSDPLFEITDGNNSITQPAGSSDLFYGLKGSAGIDASINQFLGLFLECSYGYYMVSSKLYNDSHFSNYSLEGGIRVSLLKNQRYFY